MERWLHMIKELIYKFLNKKLAQKKHDCIKLEWQKAELEQKIAKAKKRGTNNENTQRIH